MLRWQWWLPLIIAAALMIAAPALFLGFTCSWMYEATCVLEKAEKFQTLIGGWFGFGGLILTFLYADIAHIKQQQFQQDEYAKNLARAIHYDFAELEVITIEVTRQIVDLLSSLEKTKYAPITIGTEAIERLRPRQLLLDSVPLNELSRLGHAGYCVSRDVGLNLRIFRQDFDELGKSHSSLFELSAVADRIIKHCAAINIKCKQANDVFTDIEEIGPRTDKKFWIFPQPTPDQVRGFLERIGSGHKG